MQYNIFSSQGITAINNDASQHFEDDLEIENIVVDYFAQLFHSQAQLSSIDDILIIKTLTEHDISSLNLPFTRAEVLHALKHMHLEKAHGPLGIHTCFF